MAILLGVISVCAMTSDLIYTLVTFQIPLLLIWSVGSSSSNGTVPSCLQKCSLDPWSFQFLLMLLLIFITLAVHLISYWFNNVCSSILTFCELVPFSFEVLGAHALFIRQFSYFSLSAGAHILLPYYSDGANWSK